MQNHIADWGLGINLGNALDAIGGETAWKNPVTTRAMIQMYADAGFDMLRIPITWGLHMGEGPACQVDPAWMDRVEEVVRWALDAGLRVIINTHHEQHIWLKEELRYLSEMLPPFISIWRQIAERFAGVGERLVFQDLNEPRVENGPNEWNGATPDVRAAINALHAAFVRTVRDCGGCNATRWLCIPPAAAKICPDGLNGLIIPEDERIIVSVHNYLPEEFCLSHTRAGSYAHYTAETEAVLDGVFAQLADFMRSCPAPVIITEHGAVTKPLPGGARNDEDRIAFERAFLRRAKALRIPCVLWDNNYYDDGDEWFGLFDREKLICNTPALLDAMMAEK